MPEAEGAVAAPPAAEAPAQESAVPASPPASGASDGGQQSQPVKTYTGEELGKIVSTRLNESQSKFFSEFGVKSADELKAQIQQFRQMQDVLKSKDQQVDPETKAFREYMEKQYPQLSKIDQIAQAAQSADERVFNSYVQQGHAEIDKMVGDKLGLTDEGQKSIIRDLVANSMKSNQEDMQKWARTGDVSIVKKHFDEVFSKHLDPMFRAASAKYVTAKTAQIKGTPPRLPEGGAPAPTSKEKALDRDERVSGAFKKFQTGA